MITEQAISNVWQDIWCMQKHIRIGKNCVVQVLVLRYLKSTICWQSSNSGLYEISPSKKRLNTYVKIFGQKMRADDDGFPNFTFFQNFEPCWTFDDPMSF